jgi:hypothetical protein
MKRASELIEEKEDEVRRERKMDDTYLDCTW